MTMRDDIVEKLILKTGGDNLTVLLPELPSDADLAACQGIEYAEVLGTLPQSEWQSPTAISVGFGRTQQMIFESTSGIRHAQFVSSLSRGAAVIGALIDTNSDFMRLQQVLDLTMPSVGIGDAPLPPVAPWLIPALLESAANIIEKTDALNLSNVLAFNYGIFWAAAAVIPPRHEGQQTDALLWLQTVTEYYGSLGVVPN
ncbi:hypothetical protein LCGC14_2908830 [marine sediment metagenome]|uniref:Uncharacterized protein n=1 Tax=marine sediment metagenome TaxID=412755 RepID=A0A0F9AIF4_9ZZZZ